MHRAAPRWLLAASALCLAACDDDVVAQLDPILSVEPERLDFGTVELAQEARLPLALKNLGAVRGLLSSFEVVDDCGGCFAVVDPPTEAPPSRTIEVEMRFRALRLEVATGTVTIQTDDPKTPTLSVTLVGRGSDGRRPDIAVAPEVVNFGFVPAGGLAASSFVIRSIGSNDLLVDRIAIDPPDAPFSITTSTPTPGRPGRLAPGAQASVGLRATIPASVTSTVEARVLVETNVLSEKNVPGRRGVVAVPLIARSNRPPIAVIQGPRTIEPRARATLDGSMSRDQDEPPDLPLTYRWTLIPPSGSTTVLERASGAMPSFFADISGRYEVRLVVLDALGLESEPASWVVEALPTNAIRIELTWDHPDADLDLHLIREGGSFCSCDSDCHYRDCGRAPNWFPGAPGANPRLDIDDLGGFGPENINIDGDGAERRVERGNYRIAVHYYATYDELSSWPTNVSNATVRIFIYGLLAAELTRPMNAQGELWFAGTLAWPGGLVTPDGATQANAMCSVF